MAASERQEKEQKSLERLLAAILAVVDAGIVVFDERGQFVMANPSFFSVFRWRKGIPEHFGRLFPDTRLPSSMIRLPRSVSAGRFSTRVRSGDGSLIEAEVHARWITQDDEDSYWVGALTPLPGAQATEKDEEAEPAPPDRNLYEAPAFERVIASLVRNTPSADPYVMAGQVKLLDLDRIRQAAGDHWSSLSAQITDLSTSVLDRNLTPADLLSHDGDHHFTICFGEATATEAERQTARVEQELRDRLVSQFGVVNAPVVQADAARIPIPPDSEGADITGLIASGLAERRSQIERLASMTLAQIVESAKLDSAEIVHHSGSVIPLLAARLDPLTTRALKRLLSVSSNGIAEQYDHLLLGLAVSAVYEQIAKPKASGFVVPVSFATFTNRRLAEAYMNICRNLSAGVSQYIVFELTEVPEDAANQRIEEIHNSLRPFSRAQWLRLPRLESRLNKPWGRLFNHLTIPFEAIEATGRLSPERLRSFLDTLHARRCRLTVLDVPDRLTARMLAASGVDFVSGSGLLPWDGSSRS